MNITDKTRLAMIFGIICLAGCGGNPNQGVTPKVICQDDENDYEIPDNAKAKIRFDGAYIWTKAVNDDYYSNKIPNKDHKITNHPSHEVLMLVFLNKHQCLWDQWWPDDEASEEFEQDLPPFPVKKLISRLRGSVKDSLVKTQAGCWKSKNIIEYHYNKSGYIVIPMIGHVFRTKHSGKTHEDETWEFEETSFYARQSQIDKEALRVETLNDDGTQYSGRGDFYGAKVYYFVKSE